MKRIAIFASGKGTNAERLIRNFEGHRDAQVTLVVSNRADAGVLEVAKTFGVETLVVDRENFYNNNSIAEELNARGISLIVLAGFLWLLPSSLILDFPRRIVNVHPALLPKFGGQGMYGRKVHEAVLAAGEKETGITIHLVNEKFDEGEILAQYRCPVLKTDTPESLRARVQELEHKYFAVVVEKLL